jgi:ankyrin repeat protein
MAALDHDLADRFLEAIRLDQAYEAAALLECHEGLDQFDVFTAAACGESGAVSAFLKRIPALLSATHGRDEWPLLAYVCGSPLHRTSEVRAAGLLRTAELLLALGASPNSRSVYWETDEKKVPIPVLYHACMSDHPALVKLLLERGASTQDGESIYHAAQHDRRACLELLVAHGADLSSTQSPYGNTPLYFLAGHHDDGQGRAPWFRGFVWLLEHGANPNVPSGNSAETPLHRVAGGPPKRSTAVILLAHGADVNVRRADGRTPYQIAVRRGNTDIATLLRERGAETTGLSPLDEFLGACLAADADKARALLGQYPDLASAIPSVSATAMSDAVHQNRPEAIRVMAALGFPLSSGDGGLATPLHWAAWLGKVDIVRRLLELGAPVDVRDRDFGASPLGWAAHGSTFHHADDRYAAIVDLLVDAGGAGIDNKWGKSLHGTPAVTARLKARGVL